MLKPTLVQQIIVQQDEFIVCPRREQRIYGIYHTVLMAYPGNGQAPSLADLSDDQIPSAIAPLKEAQGSLSQIVAYCRALYDKPQDVHASHQQAFDQTREYALQALSGVAAQINEASTKFSFFLTLQLDEVDRLTADIDWMAQVCIEWATS